MKKALLLILFITPLLMAQQNDKGKISLVFNGEKMNLPISTISILKDDDILLSIKAEANDSILQQMMVLEFGIKELSSKAEAETLEGTRIEISTRDNKTSSGKELSFWLNSQSGKEINSSGAAHFGVINKGEKVSWEINSVSLKFNIINIQYIEGALRINGELNGTFKSTSAPKGQDAEIKNCKFEVII